MTRFIVAVAVMAFGAGCSGAEGSDSAEDLGSAEQAISLGSPHEVIPVLQSGFAMCPFGEVLVGVVGNRTDRIACAPTSNLRNPGSWTLHNRAANGTASCSTAGTPFEFYSEVAVGWNQTTGALRCSVTWPNAVTIGTDLAGSEVTQASQLSQVSHAAHYVDFGPDEIGLCQANRAIVDMTKKTLIYNPPPNSVTLFQTCAQ